MSTLKFLLEKEFKQFFRNPFLPRTLVFMPVMIILIMPFAATMDVRNINVAFVLNEQSPLTNRLIQKVSSSEYFNLVEVTSSPKEALSLVEKGGADMILEVPVGFERKLTREGKGDLMLSINSVNGAKGGIGSSYISTLLNDFALEIRDELAPVVISSATPVIRVVPRYLFNPSLSYRTYMIPALITILLTLLCSFLPALNIVSEKEAGTIEQINVTPVSKFTFIIAKLLPYWIMGFIVFSIAMILACVVWGLIPVGNVATIYLIAIIYVFAMSGFGLVISNYSATMQQAMFVIFFFMIVLMMMSGLFTPFRSMPMWAQYITAFNPLRYLIEAMRMVFLKGSGIQDIARNLFALIGFALFFLLWAVKSYKKSN